MSNWTQKDSPDQTHSALFKLLSPRLSQKPPMGALPAL